MGLLHLAVLDDQSVALAAGTSEDGSAVEGEVKGVGEVELGVCEEADAAALGGVELLRPGLGADWLLAGCISGSD